MINGALHPYEQTLQTAEPLSLVADDGRRVALDMVRYLGPCDAADELVLDRCVGPVLDIGCGPGRFVHALAARGRRVLGVDLAAGAVELAQSRGGTALRRDIFGRLPAEGRWMTALLIDGNIGIGGDVGHLLGRLHELLASDGIAIVETASNPDADQRLRARFSLRGSETGPLFPWAVVGVNALVEYAVPHGFYVAETWTAHGRSFAVLDRTLNRSLDHSLDRGSR